LNRAAAVAMASGPEPGLALMDQPGLTEALVGYRWFHSARADLLRRLGRNEGAARAYRSALDLTENAAERTFLTRRLAELAESPSERARGSKRGPTGEP